MLKRYLAKAKITADEDNFIFGSLNYFRSCRQYKLKRTMKPLSYSRTREIVLEGLKKIGLNPKQFGLHSLRAGGATSAANNSVKSVQSALSDFKRPPERSQSQCNYRLFIT